MSEPGPKTEILGEIAYQFFLLSPILPTYLHVIASALFSIFIGAHASLSRPVSAAKRPKKRIRRRDGKSQSESTQRMEGLSPLDALLYPLFTGCMLVGLYFLIKWLKDPEILNKILNWYLSVFGIFSISKLLTDSMNTIRSFIFPSRFQVGGIAWRMSRKKRTFVPMDSSQSQSDNLDGRRSPLPGILSRLPLPSQIQSFLWWLRDYPTRPLCIITTFVRGSLEATTPVNPQGVFNLLAAVSIVLYFNLVDKPWWLTNIMGFSFSYSALQLMSPTTFWTGTLVLTSLFFYDIYFVFFTPMMITVATKLDIPVKLLFPRPSGTNENHGEQSLAMLGLGDIVLPGIMIGLALRFDLHLFYLKKQITRESNNADTADRENSNDTSLASQGRLNATLTKKQHLVFDNAGLGKAEYKHATGGWGERFWMGESKWGGLDGGLFPKTYFYASIFGYVAGLICTLCIMHIFKHGQPALLYLVPGVLFSLWGTALLRGELKEMWQYTELEDDEELKKKEKKKTEQKAEDRSKDLMGGDDFDGIEQKAKLIMDNLQNSVEPTAGSITKDSIPTTDSPNRTKPFTSDEEQYTVSKNTLFALSIELPTQSVREEKLHGVVNIESALGEDLKAISPLISRDTESSGGESSPTVMSVVYYGEGDGATDGAIDGGEPPGKRRKMFYEQD